MSNKPKRGRPARKDKPVPLSTTVSEKNLLKLSRISRRDFMTRGRKLDQLIKEAL